MDCNFYYCFLGFYLFAYITGDGSSGILSVDGELVTWFSVGLYSLHLNNFFIIQFIKKK